MKKVLFIKVVSLVVLVSLLGSGCWFLDGQTKKEREQEKMRREYLEKNKIKKPSRTLNNPQGKGLGEF